MKPSGIQLSHSPTLSQYFYGSQSIVIADTRECKRPLLGCRSPISSSLLLSSRPFLRVVNLEAATTQQPLVDTQINQSVLSIGCAVELPHHPVTIPARQPRTIYRTFIIFPTSTTPDRHQTIEYTAGERLAISFRPHHRRDRSGQQSAKNRGNISIA